MKEYFSTFCEDATVLKDRREYIQLGDLKIPLKEVTEFCGPSGQGKTILSHKIAAKYSEKFNQEAVFFDVDRSFRPMLVQKMAAEPKNSLLSIHVYQPLDSTDFISKLKSLNEDFEHPKLLLIDSITNLLPLPKSDSSEQRGKKIIEIGEILRKKVREGMTVTITNQIRSIIKSYDPEGKESQVFGKWGGDIWEEHGYVPALGESWSNFLDNRILVKKRGKKKVFIPVFSSTEIL